jgi:DNA recombination protein RmuC
MSDTVLLIIALAVALVAAAAALLALFRPRRDRESTVLLESIRGDLAGRVDGLDRRQAELQALLLQQLTQTQSLLQERLSGQDKALREQLTGQSTTMMGQTNILQTHMENTQGLISKLQERMGEMQQSSARMLEMGKDMEELQRLLKAPKTRGGLGEVGLQTILSDILPEERVSYQHGFRDGTMVDAAIHLENGLLPIDAKFPMEYFHRYMVA